MDLVKIKWKFIKTELDYIVSISKTLKNQCYINNGHDKIKYRTFYEI